ncbi:hypothetical protein CHLNCDRAFT_143752 [Chlorella variabilis]|uniref:Uncharacterized protein n=1 Tax=Chlorella variabilis TaxID=554065 RepID=E1ZAD4_CHLVA|nr:hypothetical protein CHLNCDRAFT_143752 [Chlorella variabilis]EFN57040.1 hypothetical protein CHLNCDRAFT_143752 [Chlorella variabilis]|eukprot:XP_005849142.1 hypothetical protein CHLNCDRAFT_143752 [Chlorella variabilis]
MHGLQASALVALVGAAAAVWFRRSKRQGGTSGAAAAGGGGSAPSAGRALPPSQHPAKAAATSPKPDGAQPQAEVGRQQQQQQQQERELEAQARQAAAAARAASPLYRATANEALVHGWLLSGQEGGIPSLPPLEPAGGAQAPARMAAGHAPPAGLAGRQPPPAAAPFAGDEADEGQEVEAEVQRAVREVAERAFFDALVDGLRRGDAARLAALLLDARDQLAALCGGGGSGEGRGLLGELQEKLDTVRSVRQRLQRYDAAYCAQAFDLLCHAIGRLQAPARRQHTRQAYAEVAKLFAAADGGGGGAYPGSAPPAAAPPGAGEAAEQRVQLVLASGGGEGGVSVGLRLAAGAAEGAAGERPEGAVQWQLSLRPDASGDGGVVAMLSPALPPSVERGAAAPAVAATAAAGAAPGGPAAPAAPPGAVVGEASVTAAVAAARFLLHQLEELRGDVARARLAMLREAVLGGSGGVEYERARYERALAAAAGGGASGSGGGGGASPTPQAAAQAFPVTLTWLKQVLQEAPPPSNLRGDAYCRACVGAGLLQLAQLPHAVLLLDLRGIVALQNELQRLCLLAASLLIVQQVLASRHALPAAGSPRHAALCERVVGRMGALLSGGAGMEGLVLELHRQVEEALAQQAQQAPAQRPEGGEQARGSPEQRGEQRGQQEEQGLGQGQGQGQGQAGLDVAVVRRMVRRIFSTEDAVYRRVQAGVLASATSLLNSAGTSNGSSGGGSPAAPAWRRVLRGVGAEAVAGDVYRLAARVYRIAAVSTAVAEPLVYAPLLQQLRQHQ